MDSRVEKANDAFKNGDIPEAYRILLQMAGNAEADNALLEIRNLTVGGSAESGNNIKSVFSPDYLSYSSDFLSVGAIDSGCRIDRIGTVRMDACASLWNHCGGSVFCSTDSAADFQPESGDLRVPTVPVYHG